MQKRGKMNLGAYFNPTGHHVASWRHPRAVADAHVNIDHYLEIAKTAERARFDLIFLADSNKVREADIAALRRSTQFVAYFEPLTLLSAIATVTSRIGLVGTASTSWNQPFHIARKFASLDHVSKGRAGWNAVTSVADAEAQNFNYDHAYEHSDRYDRAHEVIEIVQALWDSWDDDAFIRDKDSGIFFDPDKMHELNHKTERYRVRGPLNVPRPPQGHPVLVQAGASDAGRNLAARYAEVTFSPYFDFQLAKEYYDDTKSRMAKYNRTPDQLRILPGLSVFVKATELEAREDYEYTQSLIHPVVRREILGTTLGGTNIIVGSPSQVVDHMQDWFEREACDGFNIMPPYLPGALNDFCELVIPELQKRRLFRTEYEGNTLRENLGLRRPESRYKTAHKAGY
jgi:alkanesulfonate monooxygenase